MDLSNLTKTSLYGKISGRYSANVNKIIANAPLSSYTKALDSIRQTILSRQDNFDALCVGFSSVQEIFDSAAHVAIDLNGEKPSSSYLFLISDDSVEMLASAIKQCGQQIDENNTDLVITSSLGLQYAIRLHYDTMAQLYTLQWRQDGGAFADFVNYTQVNGEYIPYMRFWAQPYYYTDTEVRESILELVDGLIKSSELNVAIADTCGALLKGRFESFIQSMDFSNKTKPVRIFFNQVVSSFTAGGLKGVIYYIFSYIKGLTTLSDDNGILTFTDNNKLRPSEYIAGFITLAITLIGSVVSVIISIFQPIITLIMTTIGSVAWGIIGSFKADYDQTYASLITSEDFSDVNIIDAFPMAGHQGSYSIIAFPALQDYYDRGDTILCFDVPGGQLFVGPGNFGTDGHTITHINFEFHPTLLPVTSYRFFSSLLGEYVVFMDQTHPVFDLQKFFNDFDGLTSAMDLWKQMCDLSEYNIDSDLIVNEDSGHLSANRDVQVQAQSLISLFIFNLHLILMDEDVQYYLNHPESNHYWIGYDNTHWSTVNAYTNMMYYCIAFMSDPTIIEDNTFNLTWNKVLNMYSYTNSSVNVLDIGMFTSNDGVNFQWFDRIGPAMPYTAIADNSFLGVPYILPATFRYGINLPKFNSSTFFSWVATAILTVTLITAATVVATVKTVQFIKKKRTANVARYFDKQSTYQLAQQGIKEEVDQEGHVIQVAFDVNSTEGKTYINQCYSDYRKTAFANNCWSKVIGGTRYDTTTFYGEAESAEVYTDNSQRFNFSQLFSYDDQDSSLVNDDVLNKNVLEAVMTVKNLIC